MRIRPAKQAFTRRPLLTLLGKGVIPVVVTVAAGLILYAAVRYLEGQSMHSTLCEQMEHADRLLEGGMPIEALEIYRNLLKSADCRRHPDFCADIIERITLCYFRKRRLDEEIMLIPIGHSSTIKRVIPVGRVLCPESSPS